MRTVSRFSTYLYVCRCTYRRTPLADIHSGYILFISHHHLFKTKSVVTHLILCVSTRMPGLLELVLASSCCFPPPTTLLRPCPSLLISASHCKAVIYIVLPLICIYFFPCENNKSCFSRWTVQSKHGSAPHNTPMFSFTRDLISDARRSSGASFQ